MIVFCFSEFFLIVLFRELIRFWFWGICFNLNGMFFLFFKGLVLSYLKICCIGFCSLNCWIICLFGWWNWIFVVVVGLLFGFVCVFELEICEKGLFEVFVVFFVLFVWLRLIDFVSVLGLWMLGFDLDCFFEVFVMLFFSVIFSILFFVIWFIFIVCGLCVVVFVIGFLLFVVKLYWLRNLVSFVWNLGVWGNGCLFYIFICLFVWGLMIEIWG